MSSKLLKNKQCGFSLIEVLISMIIIAVGLLGLSGLQVAALKGTTNAHARNVASMLAMELSERMRANPQGVAGAFYDNDVSCSSANSERRCRGTTECNAEQTARHDVLEVMCGVRRSSSRREGGAINLLPSGTLQVDCVGGDCSATNAIHNITIGWTESLVHKNQNDTDTNSDRSTKTLSLVIPVIP